MAAVTDDGVSPSRAIAIVVSLGLVRAILIVLQSQIIDPRPETNPVLAITIPLLIPGLPLVDIGRAPDLPEV